MNSQMLLLIAGALLAWYSWPRSKTLGDSPPTFLRPPPPPRVPKPKPDRHAEQLAAIELLAPYLSHDQQVALAREIQREH